MRVLVLLTDAFGGHGGIALYSRDVLTALCNHSNISEVIAVARQVSTPVTKLPEKLNYNISGVGSLFSYIWAVFKQLLKFKKIDLIICSHINLIPIAWIISKILRVPLFLFIYGIDAWQPTSRKLTNYFVSSALLRLFLEPLNEFRHT